MGFGILGGVKGLLPVIIYGVGIVLLISALAGRLKYPLMMVAFLLPLRNVVEQLQAYPMGKDFMDILCIAMLIGWLLSPMVHGRKLMERSSLNPIAIITIVYMFISLAVGSIYLHDLTFFNISDPRVQDWKNYCLFPLLFFLTYNNILDKKSVWQLIVVMAVAYLISAYYTFNQTSWFNVYSRAKITGTFQFLGPNEVAAFLNQYGVLFLSILLFLKKRSWKIFFGLVVFMGFYCVLFLFSRGAYLAILAGLFFLFAFKNRILLVPLLLIPIFWQTILPDNVKLRIQQTTDESGELESSAGNRLIIWEQSIALFKGSPIFGIGFGVFRNLGLVLNDTHNIYVKLLAEQGIIGFLIFLCTVFIFIRAALRLYAKASDDLGRSLGLGFFCCLITMLINNMFGDRWSYLELGAYVWIFAGLTARMILISQQDREALKGNVKAKATPNPKKKKTSAFIDPSIAFTDIHLKNLRKDSE